MKARIPEPEDKEEKEPRSKDKRIVLFPQVKLSQKHPDYTGELVIDGQNYSVACWKSTSRTGSEYLRGVLTVKVEAS